MTATIRDPGAEARRRRVQLASMEALGFIDRPGLATTWVSTMPVRGRHEAPVATPRPDPFDDWQPSDVGGALSGRNVRWSLLIGVLLIATGLALVGYWVYRRPLDMAAQASDRVSANAAQLQSRLTDLQSLNGGLIGQAQPDDTTAKLLATEGAARELFDASAELPPSEAPTRATVTDAAGDSLEATRLLGDAYAYREALIPALALPELEDDSSLIGLDEAAREFGTWRSKFDSVRSVLPAGTMAAMTAELELVSGELDAIQSQYLDALRNDDRQEAVSAINTLSDRLAEAEALLFAELGAVQTRVAERLDSAAASLQSLLG